MIDRLLYVIASILDFMQDVGLVAKFEETPKETHAQTINRKFRYLKGTLDFGLWYPKENKLTLVAYSDADWARCVDNRRSTSGTAFFLGNCLVSWSSKKKSSLSLSTTKE